MVIYQLEIVDVELIGERDPHVNLFGRGSRGNMIVELYKESVTKLLNGLKRLLSDSSKNLDNETLKRILIGKKIYLEIKR